MIEKNDLSFGTDKIISVASMYYKEDTSNSDDDYMRTYNVMRLGDIAFEGNKSKNFAHGRFVENTIGDGIVSHVFDVFRPISEYDLLFWKYFINYEGVMGRIMIRCTKASTMMTNLVAKDFLEESIVVPSIVEQKRIGYYLKSIDHLITLHQSKSFGHILKAIVSCTLSWEQRKLGEITERIIRKNEKLESTLPLTISAQYGLIDQNEFFDKRIASKDVRGYYLIKKGEFAYNKSTSVDAPLGAIKRLDNYKNGVLSTLYILFKIIDDTSTSSDYLVTYYATDLWHRGIQSIAAEGARNHGLLNIAPNDFFETMLSIPLNISEQKKVGDFFISLDHLITLHQLEPFQMIFKAIAYRIIDYAKSKPPRHTKYEIIISFIKCYV